MKIQATKIEAGQTIKVAKIHTTEADVNHYEQKLIEYPGDVEYTQWLAEAKANLANSILGKFGTTGKHTLEFKVLEVKEYASYAAVSEGNRTTGWNYTLLVTDKGSYLIPNRNKVTLVD